jgi:hypothetical protein
VEDHEEGFKGIKLPPKDPNAPLRERNDPENLIARPIHKLGWILYTKPLCLNPQEGLLAEVAREKQLKRKV